MMRAWGVGDGHGAGELHGEVNQNAMMGWILYESHVVSDLLSVETLTSSVNLRKFQNWIESEQERKTDW